MRTGLSLYKVVLYNFSNIFIAPIKDEPPKPIDKTFATNRAYCVKWTILIVFG